MYPELEIFLCRLGETEYRAIFRLRHPPTNLDCKFEAEPVLLDLARFTEGALRADLARYGLQLGRALFDHAEARRAYDAAVAVARTERAVRVRLCTDQRSLKLHRLHWEALRVPVGPPPADPCEDDPDGAVWLAADQKWIFSRHLFSGDMRSVRLRPRSALTALIAIASPTNMGRYRGSGGQPLTPIGVEEELDTAEHGLAHLQKERLIPAPDTGRVTLARLLEALRKEPDILYLVCHGAFVDGEPRLLLENEDGTGRVASGIELVRALVALRTLPRLVVLISCQGGGTGEPPAEGPSVLAALGPRLAEAGVPAVLAMQGDLTMRTAREFLPPFFRKLQDTGQVDEALTVGRAAVRARPDAWVPVLYTRLVEGRLWFRKGVQQGVTFDWKQLIFDINRERCVPVLGSGLLEPLVGTTREVANRLAEAHGYPLALSGREDLPQVAQFLETMRGKKGPVVQFAVVAAMIEALRRRNPGVVTEGGKPGHDPGAELLQLLGATWAAYQKERPQEPHRYLAGLHKIRTYVTTNADDLMERALRAAGRVPAVHVCHLDSGDEPEDDPAPATAGETTVYHLMGHLRDLTSLIVTEDEYFRFLTAYTQKYAGPRDANTPADVSLDLVRGALARSAILFLGFRITDWDFRVLCRLLIDQNGKMKKRAYILVQVDPEDGTHGDAVRARAFIERLFEELLGRPTESQIAVYWGSAEDFLEELDKQWNLM
jgi:hypothetical protein